MNTSESLTPENTTRPFGYWLKVADRLMADEFARAFEREHAGRRDWRLLNVVAGTLPARRPLHAHKLQRLVERGWVIAEGDGWTLTDEGRAAKDRLGAVVDGIRAKVAAAVSPEEMATTLASLEKIARSFGWDEETPLPHGRGRGHGRRPGFGARGLGHGRGFGRGFGHGRGFDLRHGEQTHDGHRHDEHRHDRHRHDEHAYERGFDAGFRRGRDA